MTIFKILLNLARMTYAEKKAFIENVKQLVENNPNYSQVEKTRILDAFNKMVAIAVQVGLREYHDTQSQAITVIIESETLLFDNLMRDAVRSIENGANNNPAHATEAGFAVYYPGTASDIIELAAPNQFFGTFGTKKGEINYIVEPVHGAKGYIFQYTTDPSKEENWGKDIIKFTPNGTLKDLPSATEIYIRVKAANSKTESDWSTSIVKTVVP